MNDLKKPKPTLNFWQLWNMSFGFFGIQFGWTLQMANTSAIYEYLGANPEQIPVLWLAAPVSGLIAQPIIGYLSDRTWTSLGRRRPYFLVGAIFSSIALILMPNSSSLWMAAGLLWILDTSVNISMEPFRAFVADVLPVRQRTEGFAMQSLFIGLGAVVASLAPWLLNNLFGVNPTYSSDRTVPLTVKFSFYLGAAVFLLTVLWTVLTTKETPLPKAIAPENHPKVRLTFASLTNGMGEIFTLIKQMPATMRQLAGVQFFTWLGMFCVFLYFPTAIARHIFGAVVESSQLYTDGIEWAGFCIAVYNGVCFLVSPVIPRLAEATSRTIAHSLCLFCGGLSTISLLFISDRYLLLLPMVGFGIAWASILSIPYAILSESLPPKNMGLYMGIFNAFIVIPQIVAALGLGWVMVTFLGNNRLLAVVLGGFSLVLAALLVPGVDDPSDEKSLGNSLSSNSFRAESPIA